MRRRAARRRSTDTGDGRVQMQQVLVLAACVAATLLIAPGLVVLLRYLYTLFIFGGVKWIADLTFERPQINTVSTQMAVANIVVYVLAWFAVVGCVLADLPIWWRSLCLILGIAVALLLTVLLARGWLQYKGLERWQSLSIGVLAFAGGNLPLIVLLPLTLFVIRMLD